MNRGGRARGRVGWDDVDAVVEFAFESRIENREIKAAEPAGR